MRSNGEDEVLAPAVNLLIAAQPGQLRIFSDTGAKLHTDSKR
jgi:hypothetical protein